MSKIILSSTDTTFNFIALAINQSPDYVSFTFDAENYTLEELESLWTGNDAIAIQDESNIRKFRGYTAVRSIEKNYSVCAGFDEDGEEILTAAFIVNVEKPDLVEELNAQIVDLQLGLVEVYETLLEV